MQTIKVVAVVGLVVVEDVEDVVVDVVVVENVVVVVITAGGTGQLHAAVMVFVEGDTGPVKEYKPPWLEAMKALVIDCWAMRFPAKATPRPSVAEPLTMKNIPQG